MTIEHACPDCGHQSLTFAQSHVEDMEIARDERGYFWPDEARVPVKVLRHVAMCWHCEFSIVVEAGHVR